MVFLIMELFLTRDMVVHTCNNIASQCFRDLARKYKLPWKDPHRNSVKLTLNEMCEAADYLVVEVEWQRN